MRYREIDSKFYSVVHCTILYCKGFRLILMQTLLFVMTVSPMAYQQSVTWIGVFEYGIGVLVMLRLRRHLVKC